MVPYNQRLQSYVSKSIDKLFRTIQFRQGVRRVIGTASLEDLSNVSGATPTDGEVLEWSQAQGLWIPGDGGGEGTIPNLQSVMGEGATYVGASDWIIDSIDGLDRAFIQVIGNNEIGLVTTDGTSGAELSLTPANMSLVYNTIAGPVQSMTWNDTAMTVTDPKNTKGLEYAGAYKANFTQYSLVDKDYVDTQITGIPGLAIGDSITSGIANRVLYEDSSNQVAVSNNFQFDGDTFAMGGASISSGKGILANFDANAINGGGIDTTGLQLNVLNGAAGRRTGIAAFVQDGNAQHEGIHAYVSANSGTSHTGFYAQMAFGSGDSTAFLGSTTLSSGMGSNIYGYKNEILSGFSYSYNRYGMHHTDTGAGTGTKVGVFIDIANGANNYALQLKDGSETVGGGKFLKDTGDGKAQWADITSSDLPANLALVGTYTDSYVPRWNATTNTLESGTIQDSGNNVHIGGTPDSTAKLKVTKGSGTAEGIYVDVSNGGENGVRIEMKNSSGTTNQTGLYVRNFSNSSASGDIRGVNILTETDTTSKTINNVFGIHTQNMDLNANTTVNNLYQLLIGDTGSAVKGTGEFYGIRQVATNVINRFSGQLQLNHTAGTAGQFLKAVDVDGNAEWADVPAGATSIGELSDAATPATDNVGLGSGALSSITTGDYNVAVGVNAGLGALGASRCVFIGNDAGRNVTGKSDCVAVGEGAMAVGTGGNTNIAVGANALSGVTGQGNVAMGNSAGSSITSGGYSLFLGRNANGLNTQSYQIAIGTSVTTTQGHSLALGRNNRILLHGEFATSGRTKLGVNLGDTYSAPTANLHVKGNASDTTTFLVQNGAGSSILQANQNGNIGIGTTAPQEKLHISTGNDLNSGDISFLIGGTAGTNARTGRIIKNTSSSYEMTIRASDFATGSNLLLNDTGGNVGVGTTSPAEALDVSGNLKVDGQAYSATHTLTAAASVAPDFDNSNVQTVTLDQATTLANPTNLKDGATYIVIVKQPAGANHTLAFGTAYKFEGGTDPTITAANGATDVLTFVSDGTNLYGAAALNFS